MAGQHPFEPDTPGGEQRLRALDPPHSRDEVFGVWLTTRQLMRFLPCKTMGAARQWVHRHGLLRRGNGTVARRDVERELQRMARQPRRVVSARSLENLRRAKRTA